MVLSKLLGRAGLEEAAQIFARTSLFFKVAKVVWPREGLGLGSEGSRVVLAVAHTCRI